MRSMRQVLIVALAASAALLGTVLPTLADPDVPDIRPHRHFILGPNGTFVEVGPRLCDNPSLQQAFNQFHVNVHRVTEGAQGPVAPGLHNHIGADLVATRDCFAQPQLP